MLHYNKCWSLCLFFWLSHSAKCRTVYTTTGDQTRKIFTWNLLNYPYPRNGTVISIQKIFFHVYSSTWSIHFVSCPIFFLHFLFICVRCFVERSQICNYYRFYHWNFICFSICNISPVERLRLECMIFETY